MAKRKRTTFKRGRYGPKKGAPNLLALCGLVVAVVLVMLTLGGLVIMNADTVVADVRGCYPTASRQGATAVWVDVSVEQTPSQARDVQSVVESFYHSTGFNDRFTLTTTEAKRIGDLAPALIDVCGVARSSSDYAGHGIEKTASPAFLKAEADKRFQSDVKPVLDDLFSSMRSSGSALALDSPLFEQVQAMSRRADFRNAEGPRRLVLVSDLVQNSEIAQFCYKRGHLPPFRVFKEKQEYQRIKPAPLSGVDVSIYMLLHSSYGPYCTEDELSTFWAALLKEAGASSVEVYRLRPSGTE